MCTQLGVVNEGEILKLLRKSYEDRHSLYMACGPDVLIYIQPVDPASAADVHSPSVMAQYRGQEEGAYPPLAPHIYGLARRALADMASAKAKSVIHVSGDGGTATTAMVSEVVAYVSHDEGGSNSENANVTTLQHALCVLNAFGSSSSKNVKSSAEYGKLIEMYFDEECSKVI